MYSFVYFTFLIAIFGVSSSRMPPELSKMLGLGSEAAEETRVPWGHIQEDLRKEPGTLLGKDFDLSNYIAQSPSNLATIETARKKLNSGDIDMYMPAKITAVECHVEFQVTERVPGRCTRLAGSIPACQAEKYIGINYNECK